MRTKNSIRNLVTAFICQSFGIIISCIARKIFIYILGTEYLGINGLFTNILTILSMMELGVGSAIVYSLYQPLAEYDTDKVSALMALFRKTYILIGCGILFFGIVVSFFLGFFLKEVPDIPYLKLIFLLFVLNSAVSYFFSYKRTLIIADQKRYIATIYRYVIYFLLNIGQCLILIVTRNYILFMLFQVATTLLENILVSRKADQLYPFLKKLPACRLDPQTKHTIVKNTAAMFSHKLGGLMANSVDNLIISKFIGIASVGIFSNYEFLQDGIWKIVNQIFDAFTASVGNMGATESAEKSEKIFNVLLFINAWLIGVIGICFWILANPFIEIFFGEHLIFESMTVAIIALKNYLTGIRKAVLTYRDAYGLYWQDRYKPFAEIAVNIGASILLIRKYGIPGVFLGTIVSSFSTCFWIEPYVLFKYAFHKNVAPYFLQVFRYFVVSLGIAYLTSLLCSTICVKGIFSFFFLAAVCFISSNILFLLAYFRKKEFRYIINVVLLNIKNKEGCCK